jgi:D-arabinose 1-dehydrogenase-like Zn-dependent alcohol dehydrogenase
VIAAVRDELGANEAASLRCAGVTTFNVLRQSGAMPGDVIAILCACVTQDRTTLA